MTSNSTSIQMKSETIFPLTPAEIWPVLADVAGYERWWPRFLFVHLLQTTPELIGTEFSLRPYGWKSFRCQVVAFEEPVRIGLQYDGSYLGGGAEWRLEPDGQGTRVIFDLDAEVNDPLVTLLGKVIDLRRIHSFSMDHIFANLKQQLFR